MTTTRFRRLENDQFELEGTTICEPITLSSFAAYAAIGSAAIAGYSAYESGKQTQAIEKRNAKVDEYAAADAQRRGAIQEEEQRAHIRAVLGAQRAAHGANNVVSSTGTPLGLLGETAQYGELDALTIANNAAREAMGYQVDRTNSLNRGRMARQQGNFGAASTLLGGGAQAYGMWRTSAGLYSTPAPSVRRYDAPANPYYTRGFA